MHGVFVCFSYRRGANGEDEGCLDSEPDSDAGGEEKKLVRGERRSAHTHTALSTLPAWLIRIMFSALRVVAPGHLAMWVSQASFSGLGS